ncbi:carbohydrate kinase family protein [Saccharomonospora sp. NB11]|uniref:carbohydrate kinase family protein n=1 Tax=Saccharomonospora sp. NB11 TaxID=1642298 RepID=UPI0027DCB9BC|nr:carbohydrate kinase family protein [Saccharomonospora sp. NB11]
MSPAVETRRQPVPNRITVVGNVNLDVVVAGVAALPPPGTEQIVPSIAVRPGGSAANTAVTLAHLGRETVLVGRVGEDGTARLLDAELDLPHLHTHLVRAAGESTSVTVAAEAPGHDRAFLSALGALAGMDATAVPEDVLASRFLLLSGYFLLPVLRDERAKALFSAARRAGARTALDTGWDPGDWTAATRAEVLDLLETVDVFLPNTDEIVALADRPDVSSAARFVAERSGSTVVVKCGPQGALVVSPDGSAEQCPTPQVTVQDSTGAGDAFNAGLLHRLAEGASPAEAADYGVRVAATVISRPSHDRRFAPADVLPARRDGVSA